MSGYKSQNPNQKPQEQSYGGQTPPPPPPPRQPTALAQRMRKAAGRVMDNSLEKLSIAFKELREKDAEFTELKLTVVPNTGNLFYSYGVLWTLEPVTNKRIALALQFTASNTRPANELKTIPGVAGTPQIAVPFVPTMAFDAKAHAAIKEQVALAEIATDLHNVALIGFIQVPVEFNMNDESAVRHLLSLTQVHLCNYFELVLPDVYAPIDLASAIDIKGHNLSANYTFNGGSRQDVLGTPVRSDIHIALQRKPRNPDVNQQYQATELYNLNDTIQANIGQVSGFVEMLYVGTPQFQNMAVIDPEMLKENQARFVVTDYAASNEFYSLSNFMLNLTQVFVLNAQPYDWAHAFYNYDPNSLHHIGGLGYRLKMMMPDRTIVSDAINITDAGFGDQQVLTILNQYVKKNLLFAIDHVAGGVNSPITELFLRENIENGVRNGAGQVILKTIMHLVKDSTAVVDATSGKRAADKFLDYWLSNGKPLTIKAAEQTINGGYYRDGAGNVEDIRNWVDSLALLNRFGGKYMDDINSQFEASFNDTSVPEDIRLSVRQLFLDRMIDSPTTLTAKISRITLNPEFVNSYMELIGSTKENGFLSQDGIRRAYAVSNNTSYTALQGVNAQQFNGNFLHQNQSAAGFTTVKNAFGDDFS